MGLIVLHSGHFQDFQAVDGKPDAISSGGDSEKERLWVIDRAHPITEGLRIISELVSYGEPFDTPSPMS